MTHLVFRPFGSTVLNNRENFISTFDKMFDEITRRDFPELFQHWGELAGYKKDEIDIEVKEGVLTISGGASQLNEQTDKSVYLLRELKRSSFSRSFKLGDQLDASAVDAQFDNGLLTVTIQKLTKEPASKKVTIK
jgi:frataxin-like iron-binding protein CyaY